METGADEQDEKEIMHCRCPFTIHITSGLKGSSASCTTTATHLELILSTSCGLPEHQPHQALLVMMVLSPSPFFLQEQLQERHYPYMVILQRIYVALFWSEN